MQPHEDRVIEERDELGEKLKKLRSFIGVDGFEPSSPIYQKLPPDEQSRLKCQEFHMTMYWHILEERIMAFTK